ncbi:hypothetical protein CROQUDRAFT_654918 [Cronartium quercuum f. sp. fusiforme G11]|uniref:mRNA 3'-end-processing protein RNA14 n=1 Tax=Cronartium quercuum f. sp. fusiforme G11 TaxID=708437 RepID=A0A9P6TDG5_9BASI|nr:hypothetical protein CROQUDRAFT_654918 [Cronartium quercuum f. sp. fusiforme G11]
MESDSPHPLRDPRLFSMQVTPSPIPTSASPPTSLSINHPTSDLNPISLRDPALEAVSMPSSINQPISATSSNLQFDKINSNQSTPEKISTPPKLENLSQNLENSSSEFPSDFNMPSNSNFFTNLISLQAAVSSNSDLNLPVSVSEEHQVTVTEPHVSSQEPAVEKPITSNQTHPTSYESMPDSAEVPSVPTENLTTDNPTVAEAQNEIPSLTATEADNPIINCEIEPARSREMSLSLDSNGNAEIVLEELISRPTETTLAITESSNQNEKDVVDIDTSPDPLEPSNQQTSNENSPSPMTIMKFPLPPKPAAENQNNTPLFAPSPPPSTPILTEESQNVQPKQPLLSRLAMLKQRVEKDRMDGEAWLELIADAEKKGDLEKTREVYKSFLTNFPDAATQWIAYAELEANHGHFLDVEKIFSHCLRSSTSVELWQFYINYIRRVNSLEGDKANESRSLIIAAYKFSVEHIGIDPESGQIWQDYINFLKLGEATDTWQGQQKMDNLRTVYQKAVVIPLNNLEQLWKDYDAFEHQMSKMTAKKFLADKSAQYMAARAALREMKALTTPLHRPKVPVKPNWKRIEDHRHLDQWKAYLQWEEKNPLELQDKTALNARIQFAYRKAVMHMRFYCEIWYLAAHHLQKTEKTEEALLTLHAGLLANSTSMVLTYAIVEIQETLKNYSVCTEAFKALIDYYHSEIEEVNKTIEKEIAHGIPIIETKNTNGIEHEAGHELTEEERKRAKQEEELRANVTSLYKPKIDELREAAASVWITEMRFARRTEGIKPARAVFTRARKSPYLTRHVFEASAMMEYHWNKEASVATKVFDLGLKSFSEDVDYVLNYLDFLISLNDDSNARALFEKTVSKIPLEAARPLWHRWAAYEYIYGDSTASHKLDTRISENFPDWSIVQRLGEKHNYSGLEDVLGRELGTSVEPIPLRRSPSPVPQHLQGFGFKHASSNSKENLHPLTVPSGPAALQRNRQRDRSFSPDVRGKRSRAQRDSLTPERRMGGPTDHGGAGPPRRPREQHDAPKRNRFSSPPRGRETSPPTGPARDNPFAWFPDGLRYFLSILPSAASFDGPCLDAHTVLQVLAEANVPVQMGNGNGNGMGSINPHHPNSNRGEGFNSNNIPPGWGPNRGGGGMGGNSQQSRGNGSNRRGRRK